MKRILMLMLAASVTCACERGGEDGPRTVLKRREDISLKPSQRQLALRGTDFALDFLREASALDAGSVLVSPLSVQAAFSMAALGARGETRDEMYRALRLDGAAAGEVDDYMKTLVPALLDVDNTVRITIANSSWVPAGFLLRTDYAAALREAYSAEALTLADDPGAAAAEVNRWCRDRTGGLIDKIVDKIPEDVRLVLLNALYFNGRWAEGFDPKTSREGAFHNADGSVSQAVFMNRTFPASVWSDALSRAVSLPYGNGAFLMTLVMPSSDDASIDCLLESADAATWRNWCTGNGRYRVALSLPRFEAEYGMGENMIEVMRRLGMKRAFDPAVADFSGVCDVPLFIGLADQKAVVRVDESGTEAAAVTIVGNLVTSVGPAEYEVFVFRVDRPFLYFIREVSTGAVLFAGVQRSIAGA